MIVIGLTGGIASGKSTVSHKLMELGAVIIDADLIAREVVRPGQPAYRDIVNYFGESILMSNGEIDRKKLGAVVFGSLEKLKALNQITHPYIRLTINQKIDQLRYQPNNEKKVAVVDAPLLIEAGMQDIVEEIWVVAVKDETQIKRLMKRDGLSEEEAISRLAAQMPLKDKLAYANRIIYNDDSLAKTHNQIEDLWQEMVSKIGLGTGY